MRKNNNDFILVCRAFLARFRGRLSGTFQNQMIIIDNRRIVNARFIDCQIWYGGGGINMTNVHHDRCTFHLFGAAGRTAFYMKGLETAAPDLIANTFPGAILHDRKQFTS